jgi:NADH-quinone oxidoreductase subunit C
MSAHSGSSLSADLAHIAAWRKTTADYGRSGCHADVYVERDELVAAAQVLFDRGYFIEDLAGVDVAEGILLVYHFDRFDASRRVSLRLIVPHDDKKAPSLAAVFSGADWHERECFDFFGVEFENHPGLKPLLLPDDLELRPLVKEQGRRSIYSLLPLSRLVSPGE